MNQIIIGLDGMGGMLIKRLCRKENALSDGAVRYVHIKAESDTWNVSNQKVYTYPFSLSLKVRLGGGIEYGGKLLIEDYPIIKDFITKQDSHDIARPWKIPLPKFFFQNRSRRIWRTAMVDGITHNPIGGFTTILRDCIFSLKHDPKYILGENIFVRICVDLSDSLGTAMIVDLIAQLHKLIHSDNLIIDLYLFTRETDSDDDFVSFYQGSGYATLMELNAMYYHKYNPIDIYGELDPMTGKVGRIYYEQAFRYGYIVSNRTDLGNIIEDDKVADNIEELLIRHQEHDFKFKETTSLIGRIFCDSYCVSKSRGLVACCFKEGKTSIYLYPSLDIITPYLSIGRSKYQYMINESNGVKEKIFLHTETLEELDDLF